MEFITRKKVKCNERQEHKGWGQRDGSVLLRFVYVKWYKGNCDALKTHTVAPKLTPQRAVAEKPARKKANNVMMRNIQLTQRKAEEKGNKESTGQRENRQ